MRVIRSILFVVAACVAFGAVPAAAVVNNTTIYAIQQGNWTPGDTVLVDSVVVIGVDVRPSTFGVYVQERPGGAHSGILAYMNTVFPVYTPPAGTVTVGDLINVKGVYAEFNGLSEIDAPTLTKLGTVTPLAPRKLPVDSLKTNYPGSERWEGVLVGVDSVKVTSIGSFNQWYFRMTTGPAPGRVDSLAGYEKMVSGQVRPAVGDVISVVGVVDFVGGERRIAPRGDADITFLSPAPAAVPTLAWSSAENRIKVKFNVALNAADATTPSKYSLSTFQTITAATYDAANKMVTLTVGTNMTPSVTPHVLSMSGIRNYQNTPMVDPQTVSFIGGVATIAFVQTPKSSTNDSSQVANQQVSLRGVVTETTGGATPDFPASTGGFYMQTRGATQYGGVFVFGPTTMPVRGDSVFVSGLVTEFGVGPETEITSIDELVVLGSNRPAIVPPVVTLANASGSNPAEAEKYECMLIKLAGVRVLTQAGPGDPFDVSQSLTGTDTLRVDDLAVEESAYTPWRGDVLDVVGIVRYSGTLPFRRLQPRNWNAPPTGDITVVSKANVSDAPPAAWRTALEQNRPNPFNPTTEIAFTLAAEGPASLRVYDVQGRHVRTLFEGRGEAGPNRFTWDGRDSRGVRVPTGLYFYRLVAGDVTQTRKMVVLK